VWKQFAEFLARLAVFAKGEGRRKQAAGDAFGAEIHRVGALAGIAGKIGFWIEQVHLRWAAGHEQDDVVLGLRREMGRRQGTRFRGACPIIGQHAVKSDRPQAGAEGADHFTTGNPLVHGQKMTSLVDNIAWAKSVIVPVERNSVARASSLSLGSR